MTEKVNLLERMMRYPTSRLMKAVYRIPLVLWRLGLGPVLGRFLVVITARGRKSGKLRHTVVEYQWVKGKVYVISAYGRQAQWYRNLEAHPLATIQTSRGAEATLAVRVTDASEMLHVLQSYRDDNPWMVNAFMKEQGIPWDPEQFAHHVSKIHMLRFDPTKEPTPLPLDVNLAWLWPLAMLLTLRRRKRRQA